MARRSIVLEVLLVGLLALMASVTLIVNHPHFLPSQGSIKEILDQDVLWNGLKSNGCQEKPVWLNKRAVSGVPDVPTAEWCGNVEKGQKFMTYSTNGYPQSAPPPYDAALNGQLSTQGWQTSSPTPPSLSPFSQAFRVLGLAGRFPPNVNVQLDQSLPYTPSDGTEHPATGAVYGNIFDPTHGTIIAYNNFSPGYQLSKLYPNAGQRPPPPQLNRWSDVVFLEWARLATAKQLTGLQFILRMQIRNEETRRMIDRALQFVPLNPNLGPPNWPGVDFWMDTDAGKAILGSPNGNGVGWLLAQHHAQLGRKAISRVTVFDTQYSGQPRGFGLVKPHMIFHLEDAGYIFPPESQRTNPNA